MQFMFFVIGMAIVGFVFSIVLYIVFTKREPHIPHEKKPLEEKETSEVEKEVPEVAEVAA